MSQRDPSNRLLRTAFLETIRSAIIAVIVGVFGMAAVPLLPASESDSSRVVDQLVAADLREHGITVNNPIDDATFVRRIYLDLTGMIPSAEEARRFLDSDARDKRARLIDELLNSEGFAHHFTNFWCDILRVHSKEGHGDLYRDFIREALRKNQPYDDFVTDLITADGGIWQNGAAGFYLRDREMPLDHMANLSQIFLGTRIGCAQCHDHPFDEWTQQQFYEMTAFTFGAKTGYPDPGTRADQVAKAKGLSKDNKSDQAILKSVTEMVKYSGRRAVHDYGIGAEIQLPDDYQYDDGEPGDVVAPMTIFGDAPKVGPGEDRRKILAEWTTSSANSRFTKVIANRLWKKVMGRGLVEPVDDFTSNTQAANAELLDFLTGEMIRLDYDMKAFLRILVNSSIYQREVTENEVPIWEEYHFPGPVMRRMTAEQVWDSMIRLAVRDPFSRRYVPKYEAPVPDYAGMSVEEIYLEAKAHPGIVRGGRDFKKFLATLDEDGKERHDRSQKDGQAGYGDEFSGLFLSSQLPMPMDPAHFLRQFGQSDREMIEAGNQNPTVPQVLSRLNGPLVDLLGSGEPDSGKKSKKKNRAVYLSECLAAASSPDEKLQAIFLSVLCRYPTPREESLFQPLIAKGDSKEVLWVLLNSHEFLFVR